MTAPLGRDGATRAFAWMVILLGLFAVVYGIQRVPLIDPDEGRNAEVAREMREAGDWITPRFHGMPYLDKPALYFDAVGLSCAIFGGGEAACRLPSVLFALGTAAATFLLGAGLFGRARALLGIAVLATAPLFVGFARVVIFDMALTFFVTTSILLAEEGRKGRPWGFPLAWVATALAVLTKGPIGLLLPVLGTTALSLGQEPPRRLRRYFHPLHIALFFAVALPWVVEVEIRNPGFLRYALFVETFERLTRPSFQRTGSVFYYVPVLLLGLFPWSLPALGGIATSRLRSIRRLARPSPELGLILAAGIIVLFFSLSTSKLGGYVLPAFPLVALLIGNESVRAKDRPGSWVWTPGVALLLIGTLLLRGSVRSAIADGLHQPLALRAAVEMLLIRIGAWSLAIGVLIAGLGLFRRNAAVFALLGMWLPGVVLLGLGPAMLYAEENSSRALSSELRRLAGDEARVAALHCFPIGVDYYMGRVVPVVSETGQELTSNYIARNFEELRVNGTQGLWSPLELESRLARGEIDILITRGNIEPGFGLRPAGRVGGYRLWRESSPGK
ncbi:MAG: glycosyltransferase family 39 protein [Candidatus Krumholzibacteria bacterium]|nr:glycosyltransferase family 39 protein [Candidatus Krumholzibacteria bacterium]